MVRRIRLTEEQHQELVRLRDHDPRPYVRERCAALLKIADGLAPHAVATRGLLRHRRPDTVYGWLGHDTAEGRAGVVTHQQGGDHRSWP